MSHKQMEDIVTWYWATNLYVQWFVAFLFFNWAATFFLIPKEKQEPPQRSEKKQLTKQCACAFWVTLKSERKNVLSIEWKNCFAFYFKLPTFQRVETVNLAAKKTASKWCLHYLIFWKKFPVPGFPVQGIAQRPLLFCFFCQCCFEFLLG